MLRIHRHQRLLGWLTLVVILPLFVVPWSHAHQGKCSPRSPGCEMTCCKDMSAGHAHDSQCPCQDAGKGCDCSCCLHVAPSLPPLVCGAPTPLCMETKGKHPPPQRAASRTERPALPPPKEPRCPSHLGISPTPVQTNSTSLSFYENTVHDHHGHSGLHHTTSLRVQPYLLRYQSGLL